MKHVLIAFIAAILAAGPATAAELTGTLKKIKDSGTITVGHRENSPPFSFVENGKPTGYSMDLCMKVVAEVKDAIGDINLNVKYVPLSAEGRIPAVVNGTVDIECGNTTNTLSRQEEVDFTNMTFITGASLLAKKDAGIQELANLSGKTVGVSAGTTTESALAEEIKKRSINAKVVKVNDHAEGMAKLESGEIDAYAGDQIVLIGLARQSAQKENLVLAEQLYSYEPYGFMVKRNDADFRLVANRALAKLYRSGEVAAIYEKWFGDWGGRPSRLLLAMFALNGLPD